MRTRDPEAKREALVLAALEEFAGHGLAGARIDRIAKAAGVSAGLVYSFYSGKEELFDGVFDAIVATTVDSAPIDADNLAEYAVRLYDLGLQYPAAARFITWYQLERPDPMSDRVSGQAAMTEKVKAVKDAQKRGVVSERFTAEQTLALVLSVANMWHGPGQDGAELVPEQQRRVTIRQAITRLVEP
jgi:AcrR family transcriptional regulator